jgi:hypothetical protein
MVKGEQQGSERGERAREAPAPKAPQGWAAVHDPPKAIGRDDGALGDEQRALGGALRIVPGMQG